MPRIIDLEHWPRAQHYRWFRSLEYPYVGVTAEVDASRVVETCKREGASLFAGFVCAIVQAANSVAELRQRIRVVDGVDQVVEHHRVEAGVTLPVEGGLFTYASLAWQDDVRGYERAIALESERVARDYSLEPFDGGRDDLLYLSCLPWVRFTQVTHPMAVGRVDSVPRIVWGKAVCEEGRWMVPVNLQAHHGLVDGWHVGRFFSAVEEVVAGFGI